MTVRTALVFRKGLDLKGAVAAQLNENYHSQLVEDIKAGGFTYRAGRLTLHLARQFGFCYGVDRAVDYAYQARQRFPDRRIFLTGEIIHNPHVNERLHKLGIRFLTDNSVDQSSLGPQDVVILPAFGITSSEMLQLSRRGCTLVDTTCGSVLNVWKNVKRYAQDGFTSVIHGKFWHEETRATASQTLEYPNGRYLVVLDLKESEEVCAYIRGGGTAARFMERFHAATSPAFDPDHDLQHIGLANQTTMLMAESLQVEALFRQAMLDRYGEAEMPGRFRAFDTICSATQDRQDAVVALLRDNPLDLMVVIGGYNSSNTCNLARICAGQVTTFHIAEPSCLESRDSLRHRAAGGHHEVVAANWLPPAGPVSIGLTSGASTPDNLVGAAIERLASLCKTNP